MEARLQSVLNQIYGSPEQSSRGGGGDTRGRGTSAAERESFASGGSAPQHLSTDEFRMQVYKVVPCTRRGPHSWVECSYAHPGEKAARRCPQRYAYVPVACPTLKREGRCPQGDSCCFAHNLFEYWLHPARYRTQLCSYGVECKRSICFFAHHAGELRITEYTNQLLALEKELEASDPTYATSNAKWGINSATSQQPGRPRQSIDGRAGPGQHRGHGRPNQQPQQHGSEGAAVAAAAAAQMAQLRQLQALQAQGAASMSHQALLSALAAGAGSGYSSHVSPTSARNAAAAAMLEAALQQQQQQQQQEAAARMAAAQGNAFPQGAGGTHRGAGTLDSQQMAAAMKMLSNMSLAGGGTGNPAPTPRLQPYNSVPSFYHAPPPPPPQLQPHGSADSNGEAMQALQLIAQLQQLAGRPGGNAAGAAHLQSTLMQSLPQLLMQMGGNAAMMGGPPDHSQRQHQLPPPAHFTGQLQPSMSLPPYFTPAPPAPPEAMPAGGASFDAASLYSNALKCTTTQPTSSGSPSPANALSVRTRHTGGSSASSQLSDGTRSPPMSHHSDEGIWAVREEDRAWRRASAGSGVEPLAHGAAGPAPAPEPEWHGQAGVAGVAGDAGPFSSLTAYRAVEGDAAGSSAAAVAKRLPLSLDDADLGMGGMSDMAGASAMIASLSQLIDGPGQA